MNHRWCMVLLLVAAMLVYGNTLLNSFSYDDDGYILRNQVVKTFSVRGLFQPNRANNVLRPVTFATFSLNWAAQDARPFGYHLVNLLLHAAVTLLLYMVLRMLLEAEPRANAIAFVAALLFAVHPIHAEAVASITGRSELLAAGFLLAAWLLHLGDRPIPSLVCLVLAMMSKESAVVFLPLAVAGDYTRGKFKPLYRYGWVAGVTAVYLGLFWKIEGGRFGEIAVDFLDNPLASLPAGLRILNALRIAWKYIALHVYPARLSSDYSYNAILLYADWRHLLLPAVGAFFVLALWAWTIWSRRSAWFLAGAIYLVGFAATSNLVIPSGTIMGERLAYLPSAGFCLLVALIWNGLERQKRMLAWAVLSSVVAVLAARTVVRNPDWQNNFTLFSADARAVSNSARIHANLGDEYMNRDQLEAARAQFQTALRIYPDYPAVIENYALTESRMGHDQEARSLMESALSKTTKGSRDYEFMKVNLAVQLMKLGQPNEALTLLDQEIEEWNDFAPGWSNRAVIRYKLGQTAAARADAETALRLDPSNAQARNLINLLNSGGPAALPR